MIYIILFIYLLYLTIKFDILGGKRYKMMHFYIIIVGLILISGFRYRLGTDTYAYMREFNEYHDLFHMNMEDFSVWRYQPLWILLNSLARTVGGFVLVQFVVSILHVWLWGSVIRRLAPSLIFSSLLFYYIFDYATFNMEVMRESVAVSCFLMALLALDKGRIMRMSVYMLIAFLFHSFSLVVSVLFLLYFKFLSRRIILSVFFVMCTAIVCIVEKNFIIELIANYMVGTDAMYVDAAIDYAQSDKYGETFLSWKGVLVVFISPIFYLITLFMVRKCYYLYVNLEYRIFSSAIILSSMFILLRYSLAIIDRMCNYFHVFTFLLLALLFRVLCERVEKCKQRVLVFMILISIPVFFACKQYSRKDGLVDTERNYSRYYPYSSIFYKIEDCKREKIFSYK